MPAAPVASQRCASSGRRGVRLTLTDSLLALTAQTGLSGAGLVLRNSRVERKPCRVVLRCCALRLVSHRVSRSVPVHVARLSCSTALRWGHQVAVTHLGHRKAAVKGPLRKESLIRHEPRWRGPSHAAHPRGARIDKRGDVLRCGPTGEPEPVGLTKGGACSHGAPKVRFEAHHLHAGCARPASRHPLNHAKHVLGARKVVWRVGIVVVSHQHHEIVPDPRLALVLAHQIDGPSRLQLLLKPPRPRVRGRTKGRQIR